ncbi:MAG: hypothetical protein KIPDCIKN_01761 [Haliscomenobacter sp.]|jgi:unsaturated rhamnogalacturonyl hydrolase|nr:hypothetical protein [Haliscomenobacter sp.]
MVRTSVLRFFFLCLLAATPLHSHAQVSMAANMAETIMRQYPDSLVVKKYIMHLLQDKLLQEGASADDMEQANRRPANWNYEIGVVLMGFDRLWRSTGDPRYLQYTKKIIDHFLDSQGNIKTYVMEEFNIDNIPPGRQLISLYYVYRDSKYLKAAKTLKYQLDWQPRTRQGGYWHKLKYPYQMWLDGLYMGQPFRCEFLHLTDTPNEWDDVANQFIWMANGAKDPQTGLMYHGFDESRVQRWANPETGQSPEFWSRAMGWYLLGLIDVLELFPATHPKQPQLVQIFNDLAASLLRFQDPQSGVWWQITNKAFQKDNYLESSGSSMFVAAMLKGVRLGYLPESFLPAAQKGYDGILKAFITRDSLGGYHLNRAVSGAGLGGDPYRDGSYTYYVSEPKRDDDLKAIGPFMQAAVEYSLLAQQAAGRGKTVLLDRYFNNEYRDGKRYHYIWEDKFDSGFSWLGTIFRDHGARLASLDVAPTPQNLQGAKAYIIVDPDNLKDNPRPNYLTSTDVAVLSEWVKNGGTLLFMANDSANADLAYSNALIKAFGISFTDRNLNFVKNDHFPEGDVVIAAKNPVFGGGEKAFVKELATLKLGKGAQAVAVKDREIVMATASYGKGKVFVIGDPWLYNEYVNGRKLPGDYQNYALAVQLARWLLQ